MLVREVETLKEFGEHEHPVQVLDLDVGMEQRHGRPEELREQDQLGCLQRVDERLQRQQELDRKALGCKRAHGAVGWRSTIERV